jgi:hypothetical protein
MSEAFFDFVRGRSEAVPPGYSLAGMRVYRHLVYLGASQMLEATFPDLPGQLGASAWQLLVSDFVRQSKWTSHYYANLKDEFRRYLARTAATGAD